MRAITIKSFKSEIEELTKPKVHLITNFWHNIYTSGDEHTLINSEFSYDSTLKQ